LLKSTKKTIIVKIGTNWLLTPSWELDQKTMHDTVSQLILLQNTYNVVLVSSGAVWCGKDAIAYPRHKKPSSTYKQFLAAVWQPFLMHHYQRIAWQLGCTTAQILLTRKDFLDRDAYVSIKEVFVSCFAHRVLPIVNENDVISDEEIVFSDNDQLAAFVWVMLDASDVVLCSDTDWLYTSHPSEPNSQKLDTVAKIDETIRSYVSEKKSSGWTGGMWSKLQTAELLTNVWINMHIIDAKRPWAIIQKLQDTIGGTTFSALIHTPHPKWIKKRLVAWASAKGSVYLHGYISEIVRLWRHVSLLAVWVVRMQWTRQIWDVIDVYDDSDILLGKGVAKIDARDILMILQWNPAQKKWKVLIHADYFQNTFAFTQ